jgi:RNA polymerase sigma-70 factor (ECF subfamily)
MSQDQIEKMQQCIDRLNRGDPKARAELMSLARKRLESLTRRMLRSYPRLKRWDETMDVFQSSAIRLCRALYGVKPTSVQHFFRIAAVHIRHELIDRSRHYFGAQGMGSHHATPVPLSPNSPLAEPLPPVFETASTNHEPGQLADWTELHRRIQELPEEDREMWDLLWYHGLTQADAAKLLGVSERTIIRRWQQARDRLVECLGGMLPGG